MSDEGRRRPRDGSVFQRGDGKHERRRRRPRGEGSIARKGDRWVVRIQSRDGDIQRTCSTQAEALNILDRLRRRAQTGSLRRYSVSDALDDFLAHGEASRDWAPATTRSYRSAINAHIRPALGRRQLAELSIYDVQRLLDAMLAAGHSGRHVAHVRAVLRSTISHAMRQEIVARNVAALALAPPVRRQEMRALSGAELRRLFDALQGERLRPLIITAATLGLRRGELIALRWSDVDLGGATLTVRRTGARIAGAYVEGHPKSERSRRTLALPRFLVQVLREQRAAVTAERRRFGERAVGPRDARTATVVDLTATAAWRDEDRVFPGELGGPCSEHAIRLALKRGLTAAGLPHIRIHDLRHSAATNLLAAGGTIRDAQEMLGHTSYALTADTYAHVLEDQRRATAERIDQVFGEVVKGP